MRETLAVGVVRSVHGIRGDLTMRCFSRDAGHLRGLREAVFGKDGREKRLRIESVRGSPPDLLVKVEGIDTREAAMELIGSEVRAPREFAAPLARDEYYQADLCRCALYYGDELIGAVRSVWDTGACQLLEVISAAGRQFLVPFIDHFVGEVDVERGRISLKEDYIVR